jgi:hypothetical protein
MSMTYTPPKKLRKPFVKGEIVAVCDRDLKPMSYERIVAVSKSRVKLEGGRSFRTSDGWWIGANGTWPFPSIRHSRKQP